MAVPNKCISLVLVFAALVLVGNGQEDTKKVRVVYMGGRGRSSGDVSTASSDHHSMLADVLGSSEHAKESLIHSYGRSFNGFAAKLTDDEAAHFAEMDGVVSVLPNTIFKLHTTRSWNFMRFPESNTGNGIESDIIVALLDTGVWPESKSFNDDDIGPPPAKWKGTCMKADNFTCNNKLIGARFYNSLNISAPTDFNSPRDSEGHGTHTASTAAGRAVADASYYGLGNGVARGAVPHARIAVYKVCWAYGCALADVLAAFDDAIADGVDVISVSLGSDYPFQYFEDPISIGSFHAMSHGVLVSASAGNSGPYPVTVANYAPWTLTVAASTIDRKFISNVALGNGQTILGNAINNFVFNESTIPLIYGGDAPNISAGFSGDISRYCFPGTLNADKVEGKIVLCDTIWDGSGIIEAKGLGMIMSDYIYSTIYSDFSFSYPISASLISLEDAAKALDYIKFSESPVGTIVGGETLADAAAPRVVSFSSRGPNPITPDILKPDLTAPGVDILAAWSPVSPPSVYYDDKRHVNWNIISGTSMSCPHASGAAAYVKSLRPNWSPAAIKSALMTTSYIMDNRKNTEAEFAYGAGHINPVKAVNPGLIFNASAADYIDFLCKQGYNTTTLRLITGDSSACTSNATGKAWSLNYPSFALSVVDGDIISGTFYRTVTNVGYANSTYYATIKVPSSIQVTVEPSSLSFTQIGEIKSFTVSVKGGAISQVPIISGSIEWKDGTHDVRTPLAVFTILPGGYPTFDASIETKSVAFEGSSFYHKNGILGKKH